MYQQRAGLLKKLNYVLGSVGVVVVAVVFCSLPIFAYPPDPEHHRGMPVAIVGNMFVLPTVIKLPSPVRHLAQESCANVQKPVQKQNKKKEKGKQVHFPSSVRL